jgi:hypothetical protein
MENRVYTISWKYKIVGLIGVIFFGFVVIYTVATTTMSNLFEITFILLVILEFIAIMSTIYFFAYKIVISDDFISTRQLFYLTKIYFKEINFIRSGGLNDHIKKIKSPDKMIRVALNDTINKPYELAMEIEIIRRQYAMVPINQC